MKFLTHIWTARVLVIAGFLLGWNSLSATARHIGNDLFLLVPAQQYVGRFLATFKEFPPRQKAGSFSIDQVLEAIARGQGR